MKMVKAVILGLVFFLVDLVIYTLALVGTSKKKISVKELVKLKNRLTINSAVLLCIQFFFALLLVFAFGFAVKFNMFTKTLEGGLGFSVLFYLPILYMYVNTWLWGDKGSNKSLVHSVNSWLAKFLISAVYLGFIL